MELPSKFIRWVGEILQNRRPLSRRLDRKSSREAYHSEAILMALPDKLADLRSAAEVAAKVAEDAAEALQPRAIYVLIAEPDGARFNTIYSSDGKSIAFSNRYESGGALTWTKSAPPMPGITGESRSLEKFGVQLVVPIAAQERTGGFLLLCEKKSGEPYSAADRALLEAIGGRVAVLFEKFRLERELKRERDERRQMSARSGDQITNLCRECPACGTCYDSSAVQCELDGRVPMPVLPVDRVIHGKYRLERRIARGGMGLVYRATDIRLKRTVALKIMLTELFGNERALHRFEREAEASARLSHPNIVRVYDSGSVGTLGAYLVMEFLEGETLREVMDRSWRITPAQIISWIEQLMSGMESAHASGIVHRDLKPENLLMTHESGHEVLKIVDFGLAKMKMLNVAQLERLTATGVTVGTVGYMPPEQFSGGEVDARADIFAIGTILLELLAGRLPEPGDDIEVMIGAAAGAGARELAGAVRIARAPFKDDRYSSISEMRAALAKPFAGMADL